MATYPAFFFRSTNISPTEKEELTTIRLARLMITYPVYLDTSPGDPMAYLFVYFRRPKLQGIESVWILCHKTSVCMYVCVFCINVF